MILMVAITVILMFLTETSFAQHHNFAIIHYFGWIETQMSVVNQRLPCGPAPNQFDIQFFMFFYLFFLILFSFYFGCQITTAVMHCDTRHRLQTDTNYDVKIDSITISQIQYVVLFTASFFSHFWIDQPFFLFTKISCT